MTSYAIQAGALRENPSSGPDGVGVQADIAYTLEARAEVQAVLAGGVAAANDNRPAVQRGQGKPLRFLSVCSGIEAASVAWPDWQAVAFSEIEKFPSAVLAHHYPDVPNLGDMTKFNDWPDFKIDVLCGGTPCQAFSVAGLREGLNDPRGNLTLTFLGIAKKYNPEWIVWENVPGILSDKTGALESFLDGLEELGYVVDVDILDAQYFGLAQRRRRIVVCGQHIKHILAKKTISSALTIAQCLQETSLLSLDVLTTPSTKEHQDSDLNETNAYRSLKRRMKLFGLLPGAQASTSEKKLADHLKLLESAQSVSELDHGLSSGADTRTAKDTKQLTLAKVKLGGQGASPRTETQWQTTLADHLQTLNECITSTSSSRTTDLKIYSCAKMTLLISEHMDQSMDSSPAFWSAAQSSLTALKGFIDYARQTSSDLFADMEWVRAWGDFIRQAVPVAEALGNLGVTNFGEVLSITQSGDGHPPSRGEKGQDIAPTISARTKGGGGLGTDFDLDGGLRVEKQWPAEIASTLDTTFGPKMGLDDQHINAGAPWFVPQAIGVTGATSHSLTAEGADASEDGTGRGTPVVAFVQNSRDEVRLMNGDGQIVGALAAEPGAKQQCYVAQTVAIRGRDGGATAELGGSVATALRASQGGGDKPHVLTYSAEVAPTIGKESYSPMKSSSGQMDDFAIGYTSAVRRLTPRECERLQGFQFLCDPTHNGAWQDDAGRWWSPDYTAIPWRNKPAADCPDGPRYKALGNSWAVPKFAWLGKRIQRLMPSGVPGHIESANGNYIITATGKAA